MNAYERAMADVTPLQARVLSALTQEYRSLEEIIDGTATVQLCATVQSKRRTLDRLTTRNALSFLAAKGLAARNAEGEWRRTDVALGRKPRGAKPRCITGARRTPRATALP